jgi:archaellum component FlaG (FlaF/FlaG flagellin family)
VSPQQATGHCLLGAYPTLVVKNTGGGKLTWNARTSDLLVHASPSSGTLATGQAKSIALSGNHVGNTLTVMFSGNGGQATITITCA